MWVPDMFARRAVFVQNGDVGRRRDKDLLSLELTQDIIQSFEGAFSNLVKVGKHVNLPLFAEMET